MIKSWLLNCIPNSNYHPTVWCIQVVQREVLLRDNGEKRRNAQGED